MSTDSFPDRKSLLRSVTHKNCRAYLKEAIDCFDVNAYRASLVMLCCAVFEDIRLKAADYAPFDGWARKVTRLVNAQLDLQSTWESNVLDNVESAKHMFDPKQRAVLAKILEARHKAAHPSQIDTDRWEVQSLIRAGHVHFLSNKALLGEKGISVMMEALHELELFPGHDDQPNSDHARFLLRSINPSASFCLVDRVVQELLGSPSDRFRRNSLGLLAMMAAQRKPDFRNALYTHLLKKRSLPLSETWILDVIRADPKILTVVPTHARQTVDNLLAGFCGDVSDSDAEQVYLLSELFSNVAHELDPVAFIKDYPRTFGTIADKVWSQQLFLDCLTIGDPVRKHIALTVADKMEVPHEAGNLANMLLLRRNEADLAGNLTDLQALALIARICEASPHNIKCKRYRDRDFADFPVLRQRALSAFERNPDEAWATVDAYAPNTYEAGGFDAHVKEQLAAS